MTSSAPNEPATWISSKDRSSDVPYPLSDPQLAVGLVERKVRGWMIEPALNAFRSPHDGFAILSVVMPYFDMIGQYQLGKDIEGGDVTIPLGIEQAYPGRFSADEKTRIHREVRHGIAHFGFPRDTVVLCGEFPVGIAIEKTIIKVNPQRVATEVSEAFERFIAEARGAPELAAKIMKVENERHGSARMRIAAETRPAERLDAYRTGRLSAPGASGILLEPTGNLPGMGFGLDGDNGESQ